MNKYRNKKIDIDGLTFDSIAESRRYLILKQMENVGDITHLRLQPKFDYMAENSKKKLFTYKADFDYCTDDGQYVVEDVKGFKTAIYRLKKKLIEDRFNVKITEII